MSDLFNVSTNPHVRSKDTTQTIMRDVLIALTPASIFGIYNFGLGALLRIVIGIAVCVAAEGAYQYFMHKKVTISDLSAAVTGLLIALNVPPTLNIGYEIVGCLFAIIIVKQLFGGLGPVSYTHLGNKKLEEAFENQTVLTATVSQVMNGGLGVVIDEARVFIPASLVSDTYVKDLSVYKDKEVSFVITEYNPCLLYTSF